MNIIEIILIAISLATDAFTVSICKGISNNDSKIKNAIIVGLYFGLFQFIMPILGNNLGRNFQTYIVSISNILSFIILLFIGLKMIRESKDDQEYNNSLALKEMIILSIATSIDALAVGIAFSIENINIYNSSIIIGIITFILSFMGFLIGNKINGFITKRSGLISGLVLIIIALRILLNI